MSLAVANGLKIIQNKAHLKGELMDTESGRFIDKPMDIDTADQKGTLESFEYGEIVQVKTGFFEVVKIRTQGKQRLVLKPVPAPAPDETQPTE